MSDPVTCDGCGQEGRRRMGKIAPVGWFYLEIEDETSGETSYVYACSKKCRKLEWKEGPGDLGPIPMDQQALDVITHRDGQQFGHTIFINPGDVLILGSLQRKFLIEEDEDLLLSLKRIPREPS